MRLEIHTATVDMYVFQFHNFSILLHFRSRKSLSNSIKNTLAEIFRLLSLT